MGDGELEPEREKGEGNVQAGHAGNCVGGNEGWVPTKSVKGLVQAAVCGTRRAEGSA